MDFPTSQNVFGLDNTNFFANVLYLHKKKTVLVYFVPLLKKQEIVFHCQWSKPTECQVPPR